MVEIRDSFSTQCSPSPRGRGLKSIRNAQNFSTIFYGNNETVVQAVRDIARKNSSSISNNDFELPSDLFSIEKFSLDILHTDDILRETLKIFLESENEHLESEIQRLNNEIVNQTDEANDGSCSSSSSIDFSPKLQIDSIYSDEVAIPTICDSCLSTVFLSKSLNNSRLLSNVHTRAIPTKPKVKIVNNNEASSDLSFLKDSICSLCNVKICKINDNQEPSPSLRNNARNVIPVNNRNFSQEEEQVGGRSITKSKSSKFRSRLNSARDDHHFFEEF